MSRQGKQPLQQYGTVMCSMSSSNRLYGTHKVSYYLRLLKGKATFEAHFQWLSIASYSLLWYPLAINYNYLNPLLFNYYTHFALRRFCDAKFLLKQTVQSKQFLWSNPSYTTVPSHCFSKGAMVNCCGHAWLSPYCGHIPQFQPMTGLLNDAMKKNHLGRSAN